MVNVTIYGSTMDPMGYIPAPWTTITRSVPSNFFVDAPAERRTLLSTTNAAGRRSPQPTLPLAPLAPGVSAGSGVSFGPSNFQSKSLLGQQDCAGLIPEVGTCVCCIFYMLCLFWGSNVPKQSPTLRTTDRDLFENVTWPPWVCTNERIQMAKISASPGTGQHFGVSNGVVRDSAEV